MMKISITPIAESDITSFRECLDMVARERKFLAMLEAPSLDHVRDFVNENIAKNIPQFVAREKNRVIGWCDILPAWHQTLQHCGALGMGILTPYRGQGIGHQLFDACRSHAVECGITRVELEARADNLHAIGFYKKLGFEYEGTKRHGMKVDGQYIDTIVMGLLLDTRGD